MSRHSSESIIKSTPQQGGIKNYKSETNTNSREKREEGFKLIKKSHSRENVFESSCLEGKYLGGSLQETETPPVDIYRTTR